MTVKNIILRIMFAGMATIASVACSSDGSGLSNDPGEDDGSGTGPEKKRLFEIAGLSINNPQERNGEVRPFADFIVDELVPLGVNTIMLRINFQFGFQSVPNMDNSWGMSADSVRYLDNICKEHGVELIPHMELFGHQSQGQATDYTLGQLLLKYPEFDECYGMPASKVYGYRSYCPSNEDVRRTTATLISEMAETFSSENFHIGCDEVLTLGVCDLCKTQTNAELFEGEINRLASHLKTEGKTCWMWGDRLIKRADGPSFGETLSEWEASANGTWPAVDNIDKNIVVCDWHYQTAPTTHKYFVDKGFNVVQVFYMNEGKTMQMLDNFRRAKTSAALAKKPKYLGVMGSSWGSTTTAFADEFRKAKDGEKVSDPRGGYVFYKALLRLQEYQREFEKNN